jgi:hypothetical protein
LPKSSGITSTSTESQQTATANKHKALQDSRLTTLALYSRFSGGRRLSRRHKISSYCTGLSLSS